MQAKVHVNTREAASTATFLAAWGKGSLLSTEKWLWESEEHQITPPLVVVFLI